MGFDIAFLFNYIISPFVGLLDIRKRRKEGMLQYKYGMIYIFASRDNLIIIYVNVFLKKDRNWRRRRVECGMIRGRIVSIGDNDVFFSAKKKEIGGGMMSKAQRNRD